MLNGGVLGLAGLTIYAHVGIAVTLTDPKGKMEEVRDERDGERTEANGAVTTLTYSSAPHFTKATTGTRFTKTYVDGLGRTKKVESGYVQGGVDTVVSIVENVSV